MDKNVFFYYRFQNNKNKISFWENKIRQIFKYHKIETKKKNPSLWFLISEGTFDPRFNFLMEPLV
jgi:hypothetical protein